MAEEKHYDIVVVGGGPGGLTAGMYGARANLKTIMVEKFMPGGQIANTENVEDYPGFDRIQPVLNPFFVCFFDENVFLSCMGIRQAFLPLVFQGGSAKIAVKKDFD